MLDALNRYEPIGIDFHTYLAAGVVGLHQGWALIYDQAAVAVAQKQLVPGQIAQPFLSPPTDAWLTAPLTPLPYWLAYWTWAAFNLAALFGAMLWASRNSGLERWLYAAAALAPWWVVHALNLGQVAPLVAAGAVLATRFARERDDVAAGLALSLLYLKPNTALLLPFALLVAGRYRAFASWVGVGAVLGWEERPAWAWRAPIAAGWVIAVPYVNSTSFAIRLNRWTLVEIGLMVGLAIAAWWPARRLATAPASVSGP